MTMRIRMLQKVKDAHRLIVEGDKGPEIQPSVQLFEAGQILDSEASPDLPESRLRKLVGYGYAEEI